MNAIKVTQCPKYCFINAIKMFTKLIPIEKEPISPNIPPTAPHILLICVVGSNALLGAIIKKITKGTSKITIERIV